MNWLDVAVVVGLAAFALRGFLKGLVTESLGFLGLLVAAAASLYANHMAAALLRRGLGISRPFAAFAAAVLGFLLVEFVWHLALWFLLGRGEKTSFRESSANWMGGALFGLGKGVLLVSLALVALRALPMPKAYRAAAEGAEVAGTVQAVAPWVGAQVAGILPRAARQRYEAFRHEVVQLGSQWHVMVPRPAAPAQSAAPAGAAGAAKSPPAKPRP
ncbi:MAG TPA: CvpA family protein [Candidatus Methylomirabilis sp.]